jgi:hypothetical protein
MLDRAAGLVVEVSAAVGVGRHFCNKSIKAVVLCLNSSITPDHP